MKTSGGLFIVRVAAVASVWSLLAPSPALAAPGPDEPGAEPDDGTAAPDGVSVAAGLRPDRTGEVTLPTSGLRVLVPRPDRARTEVFGRYVPAAAAAAGPPRLSDAIAIGSDGAHDAGLAPGGMALSISFDADDCASFRALEGVSRAVSPCEPVAPHSGTLRPGRCVAESRWDRLAQGDLGDGLSGTVWCARGLLVQVVRRRDDAATPESARALAAWLDALSVAHGDPPAALPPSGPVFVDAGDEASIGRILPVLQRFYLLAARREVAVRAAVHRVEEMPGGVPCAIHPDEGLEAASLGSRAAGVPGIPGAIAAADCFAVLIPTTLGLSVRVAATPGRCPALPDRPVGWPRAEPWGLASADLSVVPTAWRRDALDLCLPLPGDVALQLAVRSDVPHPAPGRRHDPKNELARPALWLRALGPFLRELSGAAP